MHPLATFLHPPATRKGGKRVHFYIKRVFLSILYGNIGLYSKIGIVCTLSKIVAFQSNAPFLGVQKGAKPYEKGAK